ncbi:MAG: 2-isopropylmalate synthase [Candidatus Lindowbacteria bacterium RIFCSPLOWO2_12_FULL_62_27]|nr:MAG: 2-isopropylmalate synthase [Candidatus Lindowbacteria bacterium RIFCSPLOWO2_12_FULL_62_27]
MSRTIRIFDTTLRDGEQSPGASLNVEEKIQVAHALARLRVDIIEGGFPVSSPGDFEAVARIAREVKDVTVAGLARALPKDIDACYEAVKSAESPRIHTFIATSDIHIAKKFRKTREEILDMAVEAVRRAKSKLPDVEFSCEDACRSDPDYIVKVLTAVIDAGAVTVNIPDTVGYTTPPEFLELITTIRRKVPNIDRAVISVHCHNDLGLATANSLAAILAGAGQVECTINGIGERAGNASLEEIVMTLKTRRDKFDCETRIKTQEIFRTSRLVSALTGIRVQPNKAIVGDNAFAHESGIHQDGVLKDKRTYEIMRPEDIGWTESSLVLGKHSGRHAFKTRLEEMGFHLADHELDRAFERFKKIADQKKEIYDEDLEAIIEDEVGRIPPVYTLDYVHVTSGTGAVPTATVRLKRGDQVLQESAWGDGPVDAVYNAIDLIAGMDIALLDYGIRSVSKGKDAIGEVSVKLKFKDQVVKGKGASTDIIEASAKAYINGANRLLQRLEFGPSKVSADDRV